MRTRRTRLAISGTIALLALIISFAGQDHLNAGSQIAQSRAVCATSQPRLPAGHPPIANARASQSQPCVSDTPPIGISPASNNSYATLAQYVLGPKAPLPEKAPLFEHVLVAGEDAAPVSVLGECADCHGDTQVLSDGHVPTANMPMAQCRACHAPETELSLRGEMPLDHLHGLSGIACSSCHIGDQTAMSEPPMQVCQACHGTLEDLAAATADVQPTNPHSSPHGPPYAECALCHLQHEPSQNFCASCHDFEFDLP